MLWFTISCYGPFIFGNKDGEDVEVIEYGYGMTEEENTRIGNTWL